MKKGRRLPSFFRCTAGVIVSMAVLSSLIINPLAEGTGSGSASASSSGVASRTVTSAQPSSSIGLMGSSAQMISSHASSASESASNSGISSIQSSSAVNSSVSTASSTGSSLLSSTGSSSSASNVPVRPQMTLTASPVPLSGSSTGASITADSIMEGLGVAGRYALFSNVFQQHGDMEGNVAIKAYYGSANIGNSDNVFTTINPFNVKISLAAGVLNTGKTYAVGIFDNAGATGSPLQTVNITTGSDGNGSALVNLNNSKTVYYAFLFDSNSKKYITDESKGFSGGGSFCATSNDNDIQYVYSASGEFIRSCSNLTINTIFGSQYRLNSENGSITGATTGDGSYSLNDTSKTPSAQLAGKIGGGASNTVTIATGAFPIDFDTTFTKLQSLSNTLASTSSNFDSGTMKVVNLSLNGAKTLDDALTAYFGSSGAADSTGFQIGDNQYLIVNVDCKNNNSVTIPPYKINSQRSAWSPVATRVLWNFYSSTNSANNSAFTGSINFSTVDADTFTGTLLAPYASVTMGVIVCGAVYANSVDNNGHEIHKVSFGPASQEVQFTVPYRLKVSKTWNNTGNSGQQPSAVTVALYRNGSLYNNMQLTLNSINNWSGVFENLPSSGTYTVIENPVPTGYNSSGGGTIVHSATDLDTVTITNTYQPPVYTLPSTGGPGTVIFTVIGGATTLLAIALLLLYRRRRAERRTG